MRILLVVPYQDLKVYVLPNLGLGYLAAALRKKGHDVIYLDCLKEGIDASGWRGVLSGERYDIIGIQAYTHLYHTVKSMFQAAKDVLPNVVTVMGGPHANALPGRTLHESPEIDYVFHGESESAFPALADILEHGDLDRRTSISNLAWRSNDTVRVNKKSFIDDLDAPGMPAWDLMDPRTYPSLSHGISNRARPIASIIATRGCPYGCTFCASPFTMGRTVRTRTPSRVVDEIETLVRKYGVKEIHFEDDNFTFHKEFTSEVCQALIDRRISISWACPNGVRIDSLDAALLKLMERSGCYSMAFGIESGSDRILEMMRKGISVHQIRQKIRLVSETTKIKMTGFFMVGFPDEKREDIKKTEELILGERLHRILVAPFIPYPATPLYKELVEKERIPERCLGGLHVLYDERVFVPGSLSAKQLFRAARKMQLKFYLRPKIMIGILSELRSFEQLKVALRMFFFWLGFVRIRKHEISNRGA